MGSYFRKGITHGQFHRDNNAVVQKTK